MNGSMLFLAVDVATVVVCALTIARVMIAHPRLRAAQLIALIALCSACNAVLGRADYGYWIEPAYRISVGALRPLLNLARNLTPALFMLLCHVLFAPRRRFPVWLAGLVVVQMLLEDPIRGLLPASWPGVEAATRTASTALQTLFGAAALYWTLADWSGDLVDVRRSIRAFILVVVGLVVVCAGLSTRILVDPNTVENYWAHETAMVISLAIQVIVLLRLSGGDLRAYLEPARAPLPPAGSEVPAILARITSVMEGERLYRQRGLTLKDIAGKVGVPEYRLRRIIHGELGHQNFNAFLHTWRLRDACAQLSDPALRRTPILTIALDAGYQSVNTFNRAFREAMGVTPSAYRAAPDSHPGPAQGWSESA